MRIAILSDIHSNLQALNRALEVIDRSSIDTIYCLGDTVGYGGNPNECLELIQRRAAAVIRGNHDQAAIDLTASKYFSRTGRIAAEWTRKNLTPENQTFLASLPFRLDKDVCTLVHASPLRPDDWEYVLSLEIAEMQFASFTAPICFIGHTHIPVVCGEDLQTFVFQKGQRFLVNVGSVGQPRDGNPELSFGILDTDTWEYQNVRTAYDIEGAAKAIRDASLPDVLARRLFEGI